MVSCLFLLHTYATQLRFACERSTPTLYTCIRLLLRNIQRSIKQKANPVNPYEQDTLVLISDARSCLILYECAAIFSPHFMYFSVSFFSTFCSSFICGIKKSFPTTNVENQLYILFNRTVAAYSYSKWLEFFAHIPSQIHVVCRPKN